MMMMILNLILLVCVISVVCVNYLFYTHTHTHTHIYIYLRTICVTRARNKPNRKQTAMEIIRLVIFIDREKYSFVKMQEFYECLE